MKSNLQVQVTWPDRSMAKCDDPHEAQSIYAQYSGEAYYMQTDMRTIIFAAAIESGGTNPATGKCWGGRAAFERDDLGEEQLRRHGRAPW